MSGYSDVHSCNRVGRVAVLPSYYVDSRVKILVRVRKSAECSNSGELMSGMQLLVILMAHLLIHVTSLSSHQFPLHFLIGFIVRGSRVVNFLPSRSHEEPLF